MAFTSKSVGQRKTVTSHRERVDLPAEGTAFTAAVPGLAPDPKGERHYALVTVEPESPTQGPVQIGLYAADTEDGEPDLLLAGLTADLDGEGRALGRVDVNAYPAGHYRIGATVSGDESGNALHVTVHVRAT